MRDISEEHAVPDTASATERPPDGRSYFFVNYAHSPPLEGDSPPLEGDLQVDPDKNVREFFVDLTAEVDRRAVQETGRISGFLDQDIPPGSDRNESLSQAIGATEVFVPLYSPAYISTYWPRLELECFCQRLELAGLDPEERIAPVLWIPLREQHNLPCLDTALALGAAEPEYERSGLEALRMITPSGDAYRNIVSQVAAQVVRLAGDSPLSPSAVPGIDKMVRFGPGPRLATFAVAVAAPTLDSAPADSDRSSYGAASTRWRPFPGLELSLAECVQQVAERFDFDVQCTSLRRICDPGNTPGIVLIDPWFIAGDGGEALQLLLRKLPTWVLPLLVRSSAADTRAGHLADEAGRMLNATGAQSGGSSRRARRNVSSLQDFETVVPVLIAEAERRYLRHGGGIGRPARPGMRPRLGGTGRPRMPDPPQDRAGGKPDA